MKYELSKASQRKVNKAIALSTKRIKTPENAVQGQYKHKLVILRG